jgi:hypothetical protein
MGQGKSRNLQPLEAEFQGNRLLIRNPQPEIRNLKIASMIAE